MPPKPKVFGSPPKLAENHKSKKNLTKMWNQNVPNWHLYNSLLMPNANPQTMNTSYLQQQQKHQTYMSPGSSMQQPYLYMPQQQQQTAPYYYAAATQLQADINAQNSYNSTNINQAQAQAQAQAEAQALAQQQAWLDYQTQQNYNYWYGMSPQTTQLQFLDGVNRRLDSGSLNRIDSVSSFHNQHGSRVRNSEHDFREYLRIAARKKQKQELAKLSNQCDQQHQINHRDQPVNDEIKQTKSMGVNLVVAESPENRGITFFRKLGLFKDSLKPRQRSSISSADTLDCYPRKKPNLLKRFLGGAKHPANPNLNLTVEQDIRNGREIQKQ